MPQLSTAATQSSGLPVLHSVGLLDVLRSTPAVPSRRAPCQAGAFFVPQMKAAALRHESLGITQAKLTGRWSSTSAFHVPRFTFPECGRRLSAPIPEGRSNYLAVGALSAPLHKLLRPRSEGATEPGSGRPALGQSSLCLGGEGLK